MKHIPRISFLPSFLSLLVPGVLVGDPIAQECQSSLKSRQAPSPVMKQILNLKIEIPEPFFAPPFVHPRNTSGRLGTCVAPVCSVWNLLHNPLSGPGPWVNHDWRRGHLSLSGVVLGDNRWPPFPSLEATCSRAGCYMASDFCVSFFFWARAIFRPSCADYDTTSKWTPELSHAVLARLCPPLAACEGRLTFWGLPCPRFSPPPFFCFVPIAKI